MHPTTESDPMPKASSSGRDGRRRAEEISANLQAEATRARRPSFTDQYRRWRRRRIVAITLIALGLAVVLSHVFVHLANIEWLPMQDLLSGYPMGGLLILVGLIVLGRK